MIVTLRHNVTLASDVALAQREIAALLGQVVLTDLDRAGLLGALPSSLPETLRQRLNVTLHATDVVAFETGCEIQFLHRLIMQSAFAQDVLVEYDSALPGPDWAPALSWIFAPGCAIGIARGALIEYASRSRQVDKGGVEELLDALLTYLLRGGKPGRTVLGLVAAKKTTLALTHDLHIYKAKFFPRMVRALLNIFAGDAQGRTFLDPFSGSGTALLEAASLGFEAYGVDVDPIAARISGAKVGAFTGERAQTRRLLQRALDVMDELSAPMFGQEDAGRGQNLLSAELRGKLARRDKKFDTAYLEEIERDLGLIITVRERLESLDDDLLAVLASDAVTKKIQFRYVGVGNGRYTIEVGKERLYDRFRDKVRDMLHLCDVFEWLERRSGLTFAPSHALLGSATHLDAPLLPASVDVCLTSPPYLPASSGREHYATSRDLSLAVTGLRDVWHKQESLFVGASTIRDVEAFDPAMLTPAGQHLMLYLMSDQDRKDPQRDPMRFERKAIPTWRYLLDIEQFMLALRAKISADGVFVMVVASQHIFYSHKRLQEQKAQGLAGGVEEQTAIEYVATGGLLYGELAARAGWMLEEEIRLELKKSETSVARPRSTDAYHESVLVFRPSVHWGRPVSRDDVLVASSASRT